MVIQDCCYKFELPEFQRLIFSHLTNINRMIFYGDILVVHIVVQRILFLLTNQKSQNVRLSAFGHELSFSLFCTKSESNYGGQLVTVMFLFNYECV